VDVLEKAIDLARVAVAVVMDDGPCHAQLLQLLGQVSGAGQGALPLPLPPGEIPSGSVAKVPEGPDEQQSGVAVA
jgi:hypothetical protein